MTDDVEKGENDMNAVWVHKWMNPSKTMVMFTNSNTSRNVIYTLDDLRLAIKEKQETPYRLVPLSVLQKALEKTKSLKQIFKSAI